MGNLLFGGIFTDALSGAVAALVAFTGLFGGAMAIRIGLIAIPTAAVVGLVLLLNGLDAAPASLSPLSA